MEIDFSFLILTVLVFLAGIIDSISGGGGLITIPAYMNWGLDIRYLLGTNKLSSSTGTFTAALKYLNELRFPKNYLFKVFISSFIFSSLGVIFVSSFHDHILRIIIITILPILSFYLLFNGKLEKNNSLDLPFEKLTKKTLVISSAISFYDGMLGPATGTFLAIFYSNFLGYDILKATALAKFTNLTSNISALISFIILGRVEFKVGIIMGIVSGFGNYLGSSFALKKGSSFIKPFLVIVSNAIILKIFIDFIK